MPHESRLYHPRNLRPDRTDTFILDTNVLSLVYSGNLGSREAADYSEFLQEADRREAKLVVLPEVLNEFVGVAIREATDRAPEAQQPRKTKKERTQLFRDSASWTDFCGSLETQMASIIELTSVDPSPISSGQKVLEVLAELQAGTLDWADIAILMAAKERGGVVVSHDRDFVNASRRVVIDLVTALRF